MSERFWSKVDRSGDCWLWTGSTTKNGYGQLFSAKRPAYAHRIAWQLSRGPLPQYAGFEAGICVLHRCDVRACVRPDHLFLGTQRDNLRDMHEKGRGHRSELWGEEVGTSKLTKNDVRRIRRRIASGETQKSIGADYGVTQAAVSLINVGNNWARLDAEAAE